MIKNPYLFTVEEDVFLNSLNRPVRLSRVATIREIMRIKEAYSDQPDIYNVIKNCAEKLSQLTDEEYNDIQFNYNNEINATEDI